MVEQFLARLLSSSLLASLIGTDPCSIHGVRKDYFLPDAPGGGDGAARERERAKKERERCRAILCFCFCFTYHRSAPPPPPTAAAGSTGVAADAGAEEEAEEAEAEAASSSSPPFLPRLRRCRRRSSLSPSLSSRFESSATAAAEKEEEPPSLALDPSSEKSSGNSYLSLSLPR